MSDHVKEARQHIDWAHEQQSEDGQYDFSVRDNALIAQAEATLALAEQQRIANLIALANLTEVLAQTQPIADAREALVDYHQHKDPEMGGWTEFKPEIKEALGL